MVNFDNAATSFPKPDSVRIAVNAAIRDFGGNPGRSGHDISLKAAEKVFEARKKVADFFGARAENVAFTLNCTHALNFALKGVLVPGDHLIISDMEHNSVYRPAYKLSRNGVKVSIAETGKNDDEFLRNIKRLITPKTKAVACILGSNVTGRLMPYAKIGKLCKEKNICFIADSAQTAGVKNINLKENNINILAVAAHKGLYALSGTGLLITDNKYKISPIIEGGTGSASADALQPDFLPDSLESGTVNTAGIASISAGTDFVNGIGTDNIFEHENNLCRIFLNEIKNIRGIAVYRNENVNYLPIVLFNVENHLPEETADFLNKHGFALRAGLHCAPLAHKTTGTLPDGAVRFSPSIFNSAKEVFMLSQIIYKFSDRK